MSIDFAFIPHLTTFILAINEFNRSSQCSPSSSILVIFLAILSLLPFVYSTARSAKDVLVSGVSLLNAAIASAELRYRDTHALMQYLSEEQYLGYLGLSQCREPHSGALLQGDLPQESAASIYPSSTQYKSDKSNHGDAAQLVPAHARYTRVGEAPPNNRCPVIPPISNNRLPSLPGLRPGSGQLADLELSAVGEHLARHYGMFAWRIHPLIRAHNAFARLDASFRRLDMFMHSVRAGMLYHELIIFVDHTAVTQVLSGEGQPQAAWHMYAARTRAYNLLDPGHARFRPVDEDECHGEEEWRNCLQWDALMTRVLNTAYMRRARDAVVERWDMHAREYWRRGEGVLDARVDHIAQAISAYGPEGFPTELAFEGVVSSGSKVDGAIQGVPKVDDGFFEDEVGCAIDLSSCGQDEDSNDPAVEVDGALYQFDFAELLREGDRDIEHSFKCDGRLGPDSDFGSLDSVLSDATPPPASVTPSSSDVSTDSECILYPRLMHNSSPASNRCESRFPGLGPPSHTCVYPAAIEERPTLASSSSSERIVADFPVVSEALSMRTSAGVNIREGESSLSSSPRAISRFTSPLVEVEAYTHQPSLLDLALGLGTRSSEERLRKRELTSSSSYPSPPPSPSPQPSKDKDRCPQVPELHVAKSTLPAVIGKYEVGATPSLQTEYRYCPPPSPSPFSVAAASDADCILPRTTRTPDTEPTPTSECDSPIDPLWGVASGPLCARADSDASPRSTTESPRSSRKMRMSLNLTFRNNPPSANPAPVEPRVRTAFSLWEAIMRPQTAPTRPPPSRLVGVDIRVRNSNWNVPSTPAACSRSSASGQTPSPPFEGSLGACTPGAEADELYPDTSDGEWELISGRNFKKTRRGGEKARRQRERRRVRTEMADAWNAEWSALSGMI